MVVGSGFGGAVTAYRLAEAGRSVVVVLERGKPYPPGGFPRSRADMARNFWDPSNGLHGLFDIWSFRGLEGIVSSGLGGGSLIYANVPLRKDERWFVHESPLPGGGYENWPVGNAPSLVSAGPCRPTAGRSRTHRTHTRLSRAVRAEPGR